MAKQTIEFLPPVGGEKVGSQTIGSKSTRASVVEDLLSHGDYVSPRPKERTPLYQGLDITGVVPAGDYMFLCDAGELKRVSLAGEVISYGFIGVGSTMDYTKLNDWVFFTTVNGVFRVGASFVPESISLPQPTVTVGTGNYTLAVTEVIDGLESPPLYITGAGVRGSGFYRLFKRHADDAVYRFVGAGSDVSGNVDDPNGVILQTEDADTLPGGHFLEYMGGRLVVAAGAIVYLSLPYAVNLIDGAFGAIEFTGHIMFITPLDPATLVVGDSRGVWILHITEESQSLQQVSYEPPLYGSASLVRNTKLLEHSAASHVCTYLDKYGRIVVDAGGQVKKIPQKISGAGFRSSNFDFDGVEGVVSWELT